MKVLLDTNAYSSLMRGRPEVLHVLERTEQVLMSAVVVGELMYGFRHGRKFAENAEQLDEFIAEPFVTFLPVSRATSNRFGQVAAELRRKGKPIPQNDVWIAAHALESGAELVTEDPHFRHVPGLALVPIGS